jgi:hypothetical protein
MKPPGLRLLLLLLAGLTAGATVLKPLTLAAPLPTLRIPTPLRAPGYRVFPLDSSGARRGRDLSSGAMRRFRLEPIGGGTALRLTLLPVQARLSDDMQLARFSALQPELALQERRLSVADPADDQAAPPAEQLAIGRGKGDPAGAITRLQTCITPGGRSGVTMKTLGRQLNLERAAEAAAAPVLTRLQRLSGVVANSRWECLAVQLQHPVGVDTDEQLLSAWAAVRPVLLAGQ